MEHIERFLPESLGVKDISSVTLKHLVKNVFVYSFLCKVSDYLLVLGLQKRCCVKKEELDLYEVTLNIISSIKGGEGGRASI